MENKKPDKEKITEAPKNKPSKNLKMDFDDLDLGDADGSSGTLGVDKFKSKSEKLQLPSERGRIEEL